MDLFLILLLIVAGYFALFAWIMSRAGSRWPVSVILLVSLVVYIPVICTGAVFRQYLEETGILLYGIAAVYSCLYWLWKLYRLAVEKPKIRLRVLLLFVAYLLAVLYLTVFMRESGETERIQMEVFHWMRPENGYDFSHAFQNMILFVPAGFLCAALPKTERKVFVMGCSFGLLLSVIIETAQLFFRFGLCDIDDILSNFAGAVIGAGIVAIWNRMSFSREKKGRKND